MVVMLASPQGALLTGVALLGLYVLYRAALPKPLPGIPYNKEAAGKLLGDVPEMMGYVMRTKRIFVSRGDLNHVSQDEDDNPSLGTRVG